MNVIYLIVWDLEVINVFKANVFVVLLEGYVQTASLFAMETATMQFVSVILALVLSLTPCVTKMELVRYVIKLHSACHYYDQNSVIPNLNFV